MAINLAQFSKSGTGFGQGAYEAARQHYTDAQIRAALPSSGLQIGQAVGQTLGGDTSLYQHRGAGGGLGMGTLAKAQAAGMTNAEIRSAAAMSGLTIGPKAAAALNVNPGMTYLGYSPNLKQTEYQGNAGGMYGLRPQLAPAGYGLTDPTFSGDRGYSPTYYIAGGANDYEAANFLFGTNYQGGPDIGGGYSDPDFHRINYVPPAHDPYRPFGGYPNGYNPNTMQVSGYQMPQTALMPTINSAIPGGAKVSSVANAGASLRSRNLGSGGTSGGGSTMQTKSINIGN